MNLNHLVIPYLKFQNRTKGKRDSCTPLLHIFLLDAAYQLYSSSIVKYDLRQKAKRASNIWKNTYNLYNRQFFSIYDSNMQDEIIDLMDRFSEHMSLPLKNTKDAIKNQIQTFGIQDEEQDRLSTMLIFNILSQEANIAYEKVYRKTDKNLSILERNSTAILQNYFWFKQFPVHVDPNTDKSINEAVDVLSNEIIAFCEKLDKE